VSSKTSRRDGKQAAQPRLRVLAGPNGSGKSTIKGELKPEWIGTFVNADEIERSLSETGGNLDLAGLGIISAPADVLARLEGHIRNAEFAKSLALHALLGRITVEAPLTVRVPQPHNSYLASVLADAVVRSAARAGADRNSALARCHVTDPRRRCRWARSDGHVARCNSGQQREACSSPWQQELGHINAQCRCQSFYVVERNIPFPPFD
jgi:hypothetical protein